MFSIFTFLKTTSLTVFAVIFTPLGCKIANRSPSPPLPIYRGPLICRCSLGAEIHEKNRKTHGKITLYKNFLGGVK
jgi:hypothetical protein